MEVSIELLSLGKIVIACVLGGLVGVEREFADKPAGLRTHMLVCATSSFVVILAMLAVSAFEPLADISIDPIRLIEAIVVGVSFLGAGTILKYNNSKSERSVEGLTTSASILSVAAIGAAVAFEAFILAIGVALLNIFINWAVNHVANSIKAKFK
jgi:putative Mg2+ transporter-C (MgtC) family protein